MTAPYWQGDGITLWHGDAVTLANRWEGCDVLVTDPPYGMGYVSGSRQAHHRDPVKGDADTRIRDDVLAVWGHDRPALVFGTWRQPRPPNVREILIWWKRKAGPGMGDLSLPWGRATEEIYVIGTGWQGTRRANVYPTDDQRGNPYGVAAKTGHPTPKPVGLMEQLVDYAPPGVIADPFAGSGATLIAARNLGRAAVGVEIEERYCETIARRLSQGALL